MVLAVFVFSCYRFSIFLKDEIPWHGAEKCRVENQRELLLYFSVYFLLIYFSYLFSGSFKGLDTPLLLLCFQQQHDTVLDEGQKHEHKTTNQILSLDLT